VGLPQAPVEARFSPNRQENPVAGESGPTPPEFRGRVLRHRRAGPPVRDIAIFYLGWSFRPSLTGGQRSSPSRPNQEQLSHFARAVVFEPQSPYSPPVLIHLVAPLRTHFLDVEVTACRQGDQCGRRRSIRTPRGRRLAAADAVAEMPAERWRSQEGPTPKLEVVRGTHVAPLGTPAFKVGRRVRISFAPADSPCLAGYSPLRRKAGLFPRVCGAEQVARSGETGVARSSGADRRNISVGPNSSTAASMRAMA
jgi:hypothetical protein